MKLEGAEVKNIYGICSKIGGDCAAELRLRIPYYQRPYKWTVQHIENLFADFFQNEEESEDKEYFVGSVVLVKTDSDDSYEVVDGQQRTTTVFLLNYLKFLLLRGHIEELLCAQRVAKIPKELDSLRESLKMLVIQSETDAVPIDDFIESISNRLDEIPKIQDANQKEIEYEKVLNEYRKLFGLPLTKDLSAPDVYASLSSDELKTYLDGYELTLSYDRDSYNKLLKKALRSVSLIYSGTYSPVLIVNTEVEKDSPLEVYINALTQEFNCLKERTDSSKNASDIVESMIQDITCMLKHLSFCKILTGNEHDAYTLFEVLNDRALAVDDLELVKNMFFKKYCNCSADSDVVKDKNIEKLDDLWGEVIFRGTGVALTQLISYCGSVYLTGTTELVTNKGQRYRDVLQEKYLNKKKIYEFKDVLCDFQVFQAVRAIADKADFHYQTVYKYAIMAENNVNKSVVYKTLNLIHAMDYTAVIPALTSVIIRTYFDTENTTEFDINKFNSYLDCLMGLERKAEFKQVYDCAELLRKIVLLSKDYQIPREIAKRIIEHNNKDMSDATVISLSVEEYNELLSEYKDWIKKWKYGSDKHNFRLKVLFLDLYKTELEKDRLKISVAKHTLSNDVEVALDHLDAQIKDSSAKEKYFEPEKPYDLREDYINSIGNMMILDGHNNGDKNNKPLCQALEYHKKLANHWLVAEIEEMLNSDDYSKEVSVGVEKYRVAKEAFFEERSRRLQKYFLAVINRKNGDDTVKLEEQ
ncbi:MAG: DUF262 domain-containing protein [Lachnospiraceae bacterium]|nr:DUF262 domain-containing protein [Lachnospiraceae bacterium]